MNTQILLSEEGILPALQSALRLESGLFVWLCFLATWASYRIFLKNISLERHQRLRRQILSCIKYTLAALTLLACFLAAVRAPSVFPTQTELTATLGLVTLWVGLVWIVKVMRLAVFTGFFLGNINVPVPLLTINVITIFFAVGLCLLVASEVLHISLTPLLATSAIVSIVLGLALQETLGNLLSGITLQFDKPYRIGDWIEVQGGGHKVTGQVLDISWRATALQAFTDELVILPNRIVSQAQISNFSLHSHPVIRGITFRFPFGTDLEAVRLAFLREIKGVHGVLEKPEPKFILLENGDSWITCKLIYSVQDFGAQALVASAILERCHKSLAQLKISLASPHTLVTVVNQPKT